MQFDRRRALAGLVTATGIAAAPAARPAARRGDATRAAGLDGSDPAVRLETVIRMRGALDERLVISFLEGVYYGVMDTRLTPLYGLSAGLFRQYRRRTDGGYDYANLEVVFVTDLESGGLLEEFRNPYSGRSGKPPQTRLGPSRLTITPALEVARPAAFETPGSFHRFRAPHVVGDDVWVIEESAVKAPPPMNFAFNEVLTYHARVEDLADRARPHVPTQVQFNPVIGWRPWQGMEGFEGPPSHVMGVCSGRVVTTIDELPPRYLDWLRRFHGDVAADPLRALAPAWAKG